MVRVAARLLLEAVFFAAFVFAVFIAAKESGKGRWFMPTTDVWSIFAWGPMVGVAAFVLATRFTAEASRVARGLPMGLTAAVLVGVSFVAWEAATERHGLWREWTAMDNHFSNSLQRGYYFESWVGGVGIFAVFAAYLSMRLAFAAPKRFSAGKAALPMLPLLFWGAILLRQLWVPAPYFMG